MNSTDSPRQVFATDAHLRALQKQVLRLKAAVLGLTVVGGLVFVPTLFSESIEVERLVVRGADGAPWGALEVSEGRSPRLVFRDGHDRTRLLLGVGNQGRPGVALADSDGVQRVWLALNPDGSPVVQIADADGTSRGVLGITEAGSARLEIRDESGSVIWSAP